MGGGLLSLDDPTEALDIQLVRVVNNGLIHTRHHRTDAQSISALNPT